MTASDLRIALYWMRERWEYEEGIPEFMERYRQLQDELRELASSTKTKLNWSVFGF